MKNKYKVHILYLDKYEGTYVCNEIIIQNGMLNLIFKEEKVKEIDPIFTKVIKSVGIVLANVRYYETTNMEG